MRFLADDGGAQPDELASARAELAQTRSHLGTFRLRVSPDGARATLDGKPVALIPGGFVDVRTTRGTHDLRRRGRRLLAGRRSSIAVAGGARAQRGPLAAPPRRPRSNRRRARTGARSGWFLVGGGVVAAGVGLYAGIEAHARWRTSTTRRAAARYQDPSTKARGIAFRTSADIAFVDGARPGRLRRLLPLAPPARQSGPGARGPRPGLRRPRGLVLGRPDIAPRPRRGEDAPLARGVIFPVAPTRTARTCRCTRRTCCATGTRARSSAWGARAGRGRASSPSGARRRPRALVPTLAALAAITRRPPR